MCVRVGRVRFRSQDVRARESSDHKESRHAPEPGSVTLRLWPAYND